VVQHMGGGFGSKLSRNWHRRSMGLPAFQAAQTPVKMLLTRREEFLTAGNGPGSWQKFKAGVTKDGTLVALNAIQYTCQVWVEAPSLHSRISTTPAR